MTVFGLVKETARVEMTTFTFTEQMICSPIASFLLVCSKSLYHCTEGLNIRNWGNQTSETIPTIKFDANTWNVTSLERSNSDFWWYKSLLYFIAKHIPCYALVEAHQESTNILNKHIFSVWIYVSFQMAKMCRCSRLSTVQLQITWTHEWLDEEHFCRFGPPQ